MRRSARPTTACRRHDKPDSLGDAVRSRRFDSVSARYESCNEEIRPHGPYSIRTLARCVRRASRCSDRTSAEALSDDGGWRFSRLRRARASRNRPRPRRKRRTEDETRHPDLASGKAWPIFVPDPNVEDSGWFIKCLGRQYGRRRGRAGMRCRSVGCIANLIAEFGW